MPQRDVLSLLPVLCFVYSNCTILSVYRYTGMVDATKVLSWCRHDLSDGAHGETDRVGA